MKKWFTILILNMLWLISYSQPAFNLAIFPDNIDDNSILLTSNLLSKINWDAIRKLSDTNKLQHAYIDDDSLLIVYRYTEQGGVSSFEITSYKEKVLQFSAQILHNSKRDSKSYFKLPIQEPERILK